MADATPPPYPIVDPATFDVIVSGTGLPESIIAAASAAAGKSVLHIDPNSFYGSHSASLTPPSLVSFLRSPPPTPASGTYSHVDISGEVPAAPGGFSLDLHGPRLLFCADRMVDFLLKSGASHHVEFKAVDASLIWYEGRLWPVPDSRQAVFRDKTLGVAEKSQLMRFLRLVQAHIVRRPEEEAMAEEISDEDLEMPFAEFLDKQRLPARIKEIVLYAIALADYDQGGSRGHLELMKTKEGIDRIAIYTSSIGRFQNAASAFLYPMYGHGELPQAFCRCAAVKGTLYILRMPMMSGLEGKTNEQYKCVRLASGQEIFCNHLVMDASHTVASPVFLHTSEEMYASNLITKVARGICITNSSILQDVSNILLVFPPRSLHSKQFATIRALQLSHNVAVCPQGFFVLYFSTLCEDADQGKEYFLMAINNILNKFNSDYSNSCTSDVTRNSEDSKPAVLWSTVYVQEMTQASFDRISSCPMPDGSIDYRNMLESAIKLFYKMYPDEELFPEILTSEDAEAGVESLD